jgi:hypothetical protein
MYPLNNNTLDIQPRSYTRTQQSQTGSCAAPYLVSRSDSTKENQNFPLNPSVSGFLREDVFFLLLVVLTLNHSTLNDTSITLFCTGCRWALLHHT